MREVRQSRDRDLPPPRRALRPGERLVEGRIYYSSGWLNEEDATSRLLRMLLRARRRD